MGRRALKIELSVKERPGLEELIRTRSTPQHLALRARMIVLAADGLSVRETSERPLNVWGYGARRGANGASAGYRASGKWGSRTV